MAPAIRHHRAHGEVDPPVANHQRHTNRQQRHGAAQFKMSIGLPKQAAILHDDTLEKVRIHRLSTSSTRYSANLRHAPAASEKRRRFAGQFAKNENGTSHLTPYAAIAFNDGRNRKVYPAGSPLPACDRA